MLLSIPLSLFIDILAAINGSWVVPVSLFPFRFFGVATIEVYIYGLLWVLFAVLFYEHFIDNGRKGDKISPAIKPLLYLFIVLVLTVILLFFTNKSWLHIPYFYLLVGVIFVFAPLILFLSYYPRFLSSFSVVGMYFFFLLFIFEIAALKTGQWIFPSNNFIGFVEVFGYRFPIEELFVWMLAATPSLIAYYEFFADDRIPTSSH